MSLLIHCFSSVAALNYGNILLEVMHNCKKEEKIKIQQFQMLFSLKQEHIKCREGYLENYFEQHALNTALKTASFIAFLCNYLLFLNLLNQTRKPFR